MRRLNVRCCCQPTKILGTLPWDDKSDLIRFPMTDGRELTLRVQLLQHTVMIDPVVLPYITSPDAPAISMKSELAYKAESAPLEELRLIPYFIEGDIV